MIDVDRCGRSADPSAKNRGSRPYSSLLAPLQIFSHYSTNLKCPGVGFSDEKDQDVARDCKQPGAWPCCIRSRGSSKQSRTCERQKRKGCLDTTLDAVTWHRLTDRVITCNLYASLQSDVTIHMAKACQKDFLTHHHDDPVAHGQLPVNQHHAMMVQLSPRSALAWPPVAAAPGRGWLGES